MGMIKTRCTDVEMVYEEGKRFLLWKHRRKQMYAKGK